MQGLLSNFRNTMIVSFLLAVIMVVGYMSHYEGDADAKAKAGKLAMLFSRTNTLLSLPMLVTMTMNQTIFG